MSKRLGGIIGCKYSVRCVSVCVCALEKPGLVDQNWFERNLSALFLKTLVVGRRKQSESIEAALYMKRRFDEPF